MTEQSPPDLGAAGLIAGRFRIGGLLGIGGSASVFDALKTDGLSR